LRFLGPAWRIAIDGRVSAVPWLRDKAAAAATF
jgi:hypothetical protein